MSQETSQEVSAVKVVVDVRGVWNRDGQLVLEVTRQSIGVKDGGLRKLGGQFIETINIEKPEVVKATTDDEHYFTPDMMRR